MPRAKTTKRMFLHEATCPVCHENYMRRLRSRCVRQPIIIMCYGCSRDIANSKTRLAKRKTRRWLDALATLPGRLRRNVAGVVWWDYQFTTWSGFVARFPFLVMTDGITRKEMTMGLRLVGYSSAHARVRAQLEKERKQHTNAGEVRDAE